MLNTPAYRRAESDALDRAFYWLEVVDLVDALTAWQGRCHMASSDGWRLRERCVPGRRFSASMNLPPD
jgi:hypothetical protein